MEPVLAFGIGGIGGWEVLIILVIALLIFGKRLPDVGRNLGKGLVEFKKGLKGVQDEINSVSREVDEAADRSDPPPRLESKVSETPSSTVSEKGKDIEEVGGDSSKPSA